jgi:hypothetical protein
MKNTDIMSENNLVDLINQPPHYKGKGGIESIEVIEAFELNFNLGNAIKYILRCNKKGNKEQDLEKAIWYLNREIVYS